MRTLFLSILFLTSAFQLKSQTLVSVVNLERGDFCKMKYYDSAKFYIGTKVKVWDDGGVYEEINETRELKWPNKKLKRLSSIKAWKKNSFEPKTGDTGIIVHLFHPDSTVNNDIRIIYLIDIKGNYVPIDCAYLIGVDRPNIDEGWAIWRHQDSIRKIEYAAGCNFKTSGLNNCWNRAGIFEIDKVSESFACELKTKGIDTILLCKDIFDNGSTPSEKAFVLWVDKGEGYCKPFFNNTKHQPTSGSERPFQVESLLKSFNEFRLDTVTTEPKADFYVSHSMGYIIELYTPTTFYCGRLVRYLVDENHPKSKWWKLVTDKLNMIKNE
jgi:hypothetical protein